MITTDYLYECAFRRSNLSLFVIGIFKPIVKTRTASKISESNQEYFDQRKTFNKIFIKRL